MTMVFKCVLINQIESGGFVGPNPGLELLYSVLLGKTRLPLGLKVSNYCVETAYQIAYLVQLI